MRSVCAADRVELSSFARRQEPGFLLTTKCLRHSTLVAQFWTPIYQERIVERRKFLASSIAAAAVGMTSPANLHAFQGTAESKAREFYVLRHYFIRSGPQQSATSPFFQEALIPALNRAGINPVGVFNLTIGAPGPSVFVIMPSSSLENLVEIEDRLLQDSEYQKAGAAFLGAGNAEPAFERVESSLMHAFQGWPTLTVPPAKAAGTPRIFELRSYEGASEQNYRTKVEMFHHGEFDAFRKAGFQVVFAGEVLVGQRLPKLTYMVSYESLDERTRKWAAFFASDEWKHLISNAKYSAPGLVSNNSIEILTPAQYSQI
jgi:hypothetical protein